MGGGEFLLALDDDCVLAAPNAIERVLKLFDGPAIARATLPFVSVRLDPRKLWRLGAQNAVPFALYDVPWLWLPSDLDFARLLVCSYWLGAGSPFERSP